MEGHENTTNSEKPLDGELEGWQTPELIVEEAQAITQGGTIGDIDPVDDAWYS